MPNTQVATPGYTERVLPSIFSLLPVLIVYPTFYAMLLLISPLAGMVLGLSVTAAILVSVWFAAPVIQVTAETLSVGDVVLPRNVISAVKVIPVEDGFKERGPGLSPAAFTKFQISVKTMVRIDIDDATDETPYWLIATRNPEKIKQLLESK